jgi:hypothetical protein
MAEMSNNARVGEAFDLLARHRLFGGMTRQLDIRPATGGCHGPGVGVCQ